MSYPITMLTKMGLTISWVTSVTVVVGCRLTSLDAAETMDNSPVSRLPIYQQHITLHTVLVANHESNDIF